MDRAVTFVDDPAPRRPLRAEPGRVHVWRLDLGVGEADARRLARRLDAEERARAERLRVSERRRRFEVGRGALRGLLSAYVGADPAALRFDYGRHGKPSLASPPGPRFGVAHSDDVALVALHPDRELGLDVEVLREVRDAESLARRFLPPAVRRAVTSSPGSEASEAFLAAWTRAEACIKLVGGALFAELPRIDVRPGTGRAHEARRRDECGERRFVVTDLRPGPDAVAALAVEGDALPIAARRWTGPLP